MNAYWTIRERILIAPFTYRFIIAIVREPHLSAARSTFRVNVGRAQELTSPGLVEEAMRRPQSEVWEVGVKRPPSAYDRFHRGWTINRRGKLRSMGYDHRAMEEAGFDVS